MRSRSPLLALAFVLAPTSAGADFHFWDITEIYSNADGSVQYIEFFTNQNFQDELDPHTLETTTAPAYNFPSDLDPDELGNGNDATANKFFLVATPAFASQPGAVPPDFTLDAANFFDLVADTITLPGADSITFTSGQLPTDGINAIHEAFGTGARTVGPNSPTNFAGQVGPEPSGWLMQVAGLAGVLGLARWRRRRSH